jgi:hypothetical protein
MNRNRLLTHVVLLLGLFAMTANVALADKHRDRDDRYERRDQRSFKSPPKDYRLDRRYSHDRYYPRPGHHIVKLPPRHYSIHYHNTRYYFHGGIWYRPLGPRFVVVAPPVGIVVPFLPAFYTTIWFGGIPYYYANDVYYVWDASRDGYIVTNPPQDMNNQEPALVPDELYIYPKQGQSQQKQADDRFACYQWSVKQTGYDPTQPSGNLTQAEVNTNREEYQRAMRACLEGRGYSVR